MASLRPDIGKKALGQALKEPHREPLGTVSGNRQIYNTSYKESEKPARRVLVPTSNNVRTKESSGPAQHTSKIPRPIKFIYPWSRVDVDEYYRGNGTKVEAYKRDYPKHHGQKPRLVRTAPAPKPQAPAVPIVEESPRAIRKNKTKVRKRPIDDSTVWGRR
ncbi:hypothetical protein GRF29_213g114837 [Pseudopithomyces chartarum]|uniref:Uncharacterized protein n=1 Tax=Pseudopithomyces chartarum TaxID=1892770 RepID=A0AAN6LRC7_9PLEO|nr:hypothetical protein GRF29_213g114837 [Pseudopithomyces chartarum]